MDKAIIKFLKDWQKYRRLQDKATKLRKKKPDPKNVPVMEKTLRDINYLRKEMDAAAIRLLGSKTEGLKGNDVDTMYLNEAADLFKGNATVKPLKKARKVDTKHIN